MSKIENGKYDLIFDTPEQLQLLRIVKPGDTIILADLKSRPGLNGHPATVTKFLLEEGRWQVSMHEGGRLLSVQHRNIRPTKDPLYE